MKFLEKMNKHTTKYGTREMYNLSLIKRHGKKDNK